MNSHYSLVVERQPCKLKVLGSIPSGGSDYFCPTANRRMKEKMGPVRIELTTLGL